MDRGEGERLHAARRRRFWGISIGLMLIGMVSGILSGIIVGRHETGDTLSPNLVTIAIAGAIIIPIVFIWASWWFFTTVDEVEVADNLWASLIGFYAYALILPTWWVFWKIGRMEEPNDWVIWGTSMAVALAAYAIRKWQSR